MLAPAARPRVAMLLENNAYPKDVRVRAEAESLARHGYRVVVCAPRVIGQPRRETVGGVRVKRYRLPATPATRAGFVAEYAIANLQLHLAGIRELLLGARVLHLHNPPDTLFGVGAIGRALGRKVVFDHHDLTPELFAAKFGESALVRVLRVLERWTFRVASLVLAPNESHRDIAIGRGGVPASDVVVVRNGPPGGAWPAPSPPRLGSLADPHLVFLGSMEEQDGVDVLPGVLRVLQDRHGLAGARLTLVGEGSRHQALRAEAKRLGVAERVHFAGQVPYEQVPLLLSQADVCVDPAPGTELNHASTMTKIAEYLAAGRPIVAYPLRETRRTAGDVPRYAEQGSGESFADQIAHLARSEEERTERAERGRRRARDLTWERSEAALLTAYARITAGAAYASAPEIR